MAAVGTMMWSDLPPAGNPIALRGEKGLLEFPGYVPLWVNSGTAALALALIAARRQHLQIEQPEVILPGYGCPDLVSAAEFAGFRAVLVDIGAEDPGYDLAALATALNANTIAVVAVNFLGIKERLDDIRNLIGPNIALIEDNAQWFPEPVDDLNGDFVCLSFGRGKPVSLLGGGALLIKESLAKVVMSLSPMDRPVSPGSSYSLKVAAYNFLLNPIVYGLLSSNAWLKLGQTRYKRLGVIQMMDERRLSLLAANAQIYFGRERRSEIRLRELIARNSQLIDISSEVGTRSGRLLRYPILCSDARQRDKLWAVLRAEGLGSTSMYQKALPEIPDAAARIVVSDDLIGAKTFAQRLLTLPVHEGVSAKHLNRLGNILARA